MEMKVKNIITFFREKKEKKKLMELQNIAQTVQSKSADDRLVFCRELLFLLKQAYEEKKYSYCVKLAALAKSFKTPIEDLDFLRALAFLKLGDVGSAREALKEELRYFPNNMQAVNIIEELPSPSWCEIPVQAPKDFVKLYSEVAPYTMLSSSRLLSLYTHAQEICERGVEGNFVECGVAGGGSSGLLAAVLKQKDLQNPKRTLFCCDSFEGMPPATEYDTHDGRYAEETGWGNGTCAAPETSVIEICQKLSVDDIIQIVKGYFEQTLPVMRSQMGQIAFLHMDSDWYESTKAIFDNLYDLLVPGAYVQIDDYGHWDGCKKAVHEFFTLRGKPLADIQKIDNSGVFFYKN